MGRFLSYLRSQQRSISPIAFFLWLVFSLLLSIPLVKYGLDTAYHLEGGVAFDISNPRNLAMIAGALLLLLPIIFVESIAVFLRSGDIRKYYLQFSGVLGLILGVRP